MDGVTKKLTKEDKLKMLLNRIDAIEEPGYIKEELKADIESLVMNNQPEEGK